MRYFLSALLLTVSFKAFSANHMLVIGGGGESHTDANGVRINSTIFDGDIEAIGRFKNSRRANWQTEIIFNGGHTQSENILRNQFGGFAPGTQTFTTENYNAIIAHYEQQINSGVIKIGDQLLIDINTHGAIRYAPEEQSHSISTAEGVITNYETLGSTSVSLDKLKNLVSLAHQKGVKLAIIDNSCHSGATLEIGLASTCIISSAGTNNYGYAGSVAFSKKLHDGFRPGRNLEEIFLEARRTMDDRSFPMINSPKGMDVQSRLYSDLTPLMYYFEYGPDKLKPYLEKDMSCTSCTNYAQQFQRLNQQIDELILVSDIDGILAAQAFKTAVQNYYNYQNTIRSNMQRYGFQMNGSQIKEYCTQITANRAQGIYAERPCAQYTIENLVTMDFDSIISHFEENLTRAKSAHERAQIQANLSNMRQARAEKAKVLADYPDYPQQKNFWENYRLSVEETENLTREVARTQRIVYDSFYQKSPASGANPCKDFVL